MSGLIQAVLTSAAVLTALTTIAGFLWRPLKNAFRHVVTEIVEDLTKELRPNGGGSIKDQVKKISETIQASDTKVQTTLVGFDHRISSLEKQPPRRFTFFG